MFKRLIGRPIVAALRKDVEGERVLFQGEADGAVRRFSGRVPGLRANVDKSWFIAAFAVTDTRVVAFTTGGKIVDVGYAMSSDGPATLTLESDGLHVVWDLDRVHPACHGEMKLHIKTPIPDTELIQFPVKELSFNVDPQKVVRFTGSRRKLPETAE